jgi:2-polyprenyl-3-methyl-5-hydroxy-6-metoxy-1,4-benzoquinol methylase
MSSNPEKIFKKYNSVSDEVWRDVIAQSALDPMIDGIAFPLLPDEATQRHFVGSTLAQNVNVPFQYYKAVKDTYESKFGEIDVQTRLLDVGSGWGRMIRFFIKDIAPSNLMGCDVDPKSINICDTCFRGELNFQLIRTLPPTSYEDEYFHIVEGYSVFSHLSCYAVMLWMHEYFRILKPGGMLAMTVWKQNRIDFIRKLQSEPLRTPDTERYYYDLQSSFSPHCELEEDLYKKTGFVYIPYRPDTETTYGEAFVSPDFLASHWSTFFEHISNCDYGGDQQIVFLRKKPNIPKIKSETLQEMARIAKLYDIQSICVNSYNKKMRSEIGNGYQDRFAEKDALLRRSEEQLAEKTRRIDELLASASWRVTKPLRRAYGLLMKFRPKILG